MSDKYTGLFRWKIDSRKEKRMRKVLLIALILVISTATVFAGGQSENSGKDDGLLIGAVFADLGNTAYVNMGKAMAAKAESYGGKVILKDTGGDAGTLVEVIENFIIAGCDVIVEQNSDQQITEDVNQRARDAGINIISFDAEMDLADVSYLADNYDLGYMIGSMAGDWITEALGGEAKLGLLTARAYDFILVRQAGIEAGLADTAPNAEIVISADAVTVVDGTDVSESFLQAVPDLNGIVGINDSVVLGAYEAFKSAGRVGDDVGLFACDGTTEGLAAVAEGSIHRGTVSLHLNKVGELMVDDALAMKNGETISEHIKYFPLEQVTIDNVDEFIE